MGILGTVIKYDAQRFTAMHVFFLEMADVLLLDDEGE